MVRARVLGIPDGMDDISIYADDGSLHDLLVGIFYFCPFRVVMVYCSSRDLCACFRVYLFFSFTIGRCYYDGPVTLSLIHILDTRALEEMPTYYLETMMKVRRLLEEKMTGFTEKDQTHYQAMLFMIKQIVGKPARMN